MSYRSLEVQLNVVQPPAKSSGAGDIGVKEAFAQQKQTEEAALRGNVCARVVCVCVCVVCVRVCVVCVCVWCVCVVCVCVCVCVCNCVLSWPGFSSVANCKAVVAHQFSITLAHTCTVYPHEYTLVRVQLLIISETAVMACQFYIRNTRRYLLVQTLPDLGMWEGGGGNGVPQDFSAIVYSKTITTVCVDCGRFMLLYLAMYFDIGLVANMQMCSFCWSLSNT